MSENRDQIIKRVEQDDDCKSNDSSLFNEPTFANVTSSDDGVVSLDVPSIASDEGIEQIGETSIKDTYYSQFTSPEKQTPEKPNKISLMDLVLGKAEEPDDDMDNPYCGYLEANKENIDPSLKDFCNSLVIIHNNFTGNGPSTPPALGMNYTKIDQESPAKTNSCTYKKTPHTEGFSLFPNGVSCRELRVPKPQVLEKAPKATMRGKYAKKQQAKNQKALFND